MDEARATKSYKLIDGERYEVWLTLFLKDPRLVLVHIPIKYYSFFVQPLLRLLFGEDHDEDAAKIVWTHRHDFLNISITPVECSIVCTRDLAERFFRPLADLFNELSTKSGKDEIIIGRDDYIVIQVEGQGFDAGQRVLELTSPLAMAGISIFFFTTYFADYILVPSRSRKTVTTALEQRGFIFSRTADAFVSQLSPCSPSAPRHSHTHNLSSSTSSLDFGPPSTPPAVSVPELQTRTFARLNAHNIAPHVDRSIRLVFCAGSKDPDPALAQDLQADLLQVLLATVPADLLQATASPLSPNTYENLDFSTRFLSLTLTANEPISVLLEHSLISHLGSSLLGAKDDDDILVPITLDLRDLPMEATGIVCGVAGRLASRTLGEGEDMEPSPGTKKPVVDEMQPVEISFLSTARAGTVIVRESELERVVKSLRDAGEEAALNTNGLYMEDGMGVVGRLEGLGLFSR